MKRELFKHKLAYFCLTFFLLICVIIFLASWPNMIAQRAVIAAMSVFYFCWGLFTHSKSKTLSGRVALEYGAVAILGGVILTALTL